MGLLLFLIALFPVAVLCGIADPGGHITFLHDNSSLRYSDFTTDARCVADASLEPCRNKWWTQADKSEFVAIKQMHSTAGPSASMAFTFTGSTVIILRGLRDPNVEVLSTINGQPVSTTVDSVPATFSLLIDGLDPDAVNTFAIGYAGSGILSVVVLYLESGGRAAPPPEEPPTTDSNSSSTPAPSSTNEPGPGATSSVPKEQTTESTISSSSTAPGTSPSGSGTLSIPTDSMSHILPPGADDFPPTSSARGSGVHIILIVSILAGVFGVLLVSAVLFFWRWRRRRQLDAAFTPLELHSPREPEAAVPFDVVVDMTATPRRSKLLPLRADQLQAVDMSPPSYASISVSRNSTALLSDV